MNPIRVLHVMNNFVDSSIYRIVERIVATLGNESFEWHIGVLGRSGEHEKLNEMGAQTIRFLPEGKDWNSVNRKMNAYICEHKFDIVHTHTPRTIFYSSMAMFGMKKRPFHLATKHLLTTSQDRQSGALFSALDYVSLYIPDKIAAVSESIATSITALPAMPKNKVVLVRNAIPCADYYCPEKRSSARQEFGLEPSQTTFGYTGRIEPVKLLDLLIQAFANIHAVHPETRLLLVGDGSERPALERLARDLGISDALIWTGYRSDIANLLACMDVYVQPSHNEGLSLSILEAMAAGKPVIATDVGGTREILDDRQNGLLIQPRSIDDLSNAMLEMVIQPGLRQQFAETGYRRVFEKFNLQNMVNAYAQIYRSVAMKN